MRHIAFLARHAWRRISRGQPERIVKGGAVYYRYRGVLYPEHLNTGNAVRFIQATALKYCTGKGVDIGCGSWPLPGALAVENEESQNAYCLDAFDDGSLDFVFSSHCLEHLDRWQDALRVLIRKLKDRGILFLYLPHPSMKLWRPGAPWVRYEHKWVPTTRVIERFIVSNGMKIIESTSGADEYLSFRVVSEKAAAWSH